MDGNRSCAIRDPKVVDDNVVIKLGVASASLAPKGLSLFPPVSTIVRFLMNHQLLLLLLLFVQSERVWTSRRSR